MNILSHIATCLIILPLALFAMSYKNSGRGLMDESEVKEFCRSLKKGRKS